MAIETPKEGGSFVTSTMTAELAGHILDIKMFDVPFLVAGRYPRRQMELDIPIKKHIYTQEEKRKRAMRRAKHTVCSTVNANYYPFISSYTKRTSSLRPSLVSLTFKDNITDIGKANKYLNKFFKAYNKATATKPQYTEVVEFQNRGAIHYHIIIFNAPFITKATLRSIWKHGFADIRSIKQGSNVGMYVTKYMTKNIYDRRLCGKKSYSMSKGLLRAVKNSFEEVVDVVQKMLPKEAMEFVRTVYTDNLGEMMFVRFNLFRFSSVLQQVHTHLTTYTSDA
jgi:hypothetical protein